MILETGIIFAKAFYQFPHNNHVVNMAEHNINIKYCAKE